MNAPASFPTGINLRYSIRRLSDGWAVFDNQKLCFEDRGLTWDEAHCLAEQWERETAEPAGDEYASHADSAADRRHQERMEARHG